jgi:heptosyltransferase-1
MMKILIIKPSSLGDIIHAIPLLKVLGDTFSKAQIDWVISKNLSEILRGNPLINRLIVFDKDSWKKPGNLFESTKEIIKLAKTLRSEHYDIVLDLQGLLRSGLLTFFSDSPLKIGFRNAREGSKLFYNRKVNVNGVVHAVDRYLEVAKSLGAKPEKIEFPIYIEDSDRENIKNLTGNISEYIVIAPSARWKTKRWPPESFGTLASKLPVPCFITGSSSDRIMVEHAIAASNGQGINLCGKTTLKGLAALIEGAKAVVCNDSGPLHIAAALKVPVVALFGPTDPEKTGPYGWAGSGSVREHDYLKVIRTSIPCRPCFKKKCKDPKCMEEISVDTVLNEIKALL